MSNTKMSTGDETPKGRHSKSRSSSRKPTSNAAISNAEKSRAEATSPSGMARGATRGQAAPAAEGPRPGGAAGRLGPQNPAPCLQDIIRRQLEKSLGALLLGYSSRGSPPGVLQPDGTAALAGDTSVAPSINISDPVPFGLPYEPGETRNPTAAAPPTLSASTTLQPTLHSPHPPSLTMMCAKNDSLPEPTSSPTPPPASPASSYDEITAAEFSPQPRLPAGYWAHSEWARRRGDADRLVRAAPPSPFTGLGAAATVQAVAAAVAARVASETQRRLSSASVMTLASLSGGSYASSSSGNNSFVNVDAASDLLDRDALGGCAPPQSQRQGDEGDDNEVEWRQHFGTRAGLFRPPPPPLQGRGQRDFIGRRWQQNQSRQQRVERRGRGGGRGVDLMSPEADDIAPSETCTEKCSCEEGERGFVMLDRP